MKRILITGANSYIGTSFEKWLSSCPEEYSVDTVDMKDNKWKEKDFSGYDVVFHVAGIAHVRETKENQYLYYKVNRDLTIDAANKAKKEGVKQFIFLSSMSVYGLKNGVINLNTPINPDSNYGRSKIQAEDSIKLLDENSFKVAILRPPMVYGKGCKGNYSKLANLAIKIPFFPNINNKRSMIYIDNLSEFVRILIDNDSNGLFFPQNIEYVKTSKMVELIAKAHGKKIILTSLFNPLITLLKFNLFNKVFGDLVYETNLSKDNFMYEKNFINFEKSIDLAEE